MRKTKHVWATSVFKLESQAHWIFFLEEHHTEKDKYCRLKSIYCCRNESMIYENQYYRSFTNGFVVVFVIVSGEKQMFWVLQRILIAKAVFYLLPLLGMRHIWKMFCCQFFSVHFGLLINNLTYPNGCTSCAKAIRKMHCHHVCDWSGVQNEYITKSARECMVSDTLKDSFYWSLYLPVLLHISLSHSHTWCNPACRPLLSL